MSIPVRIEIPGIEGQELPEPWWEVTASPDALRRHAEMIERIIRSTGMPDQDAPALYAEAKKRLEAY